MTLKGLLSDLQIAWTCQQLSIKGSVDLITGGSRIIDFSSAAPDHKFSECTEEAWLQKLLVSDFNCFTEVLSHFVALHDTRQNEFVIENHVKCS